MGISVMNRDIPSSTLAALRGILVSSLARENLAPHDVIIEEVSKLKTTRRVHFREAGGTVSEEVNQRATSAHNRHSSNRDTKRRSLYDEDSLDGDNSNGKYGREPSGSAAKDIDRVKLVRERQNEERQRKLEELRHQALAAQRFREQREEERRRRIDELRSRDNDRRSQVEERKRLIWEAERERREAILRKNQEREARIEAKKKNERSHIVFAFGSSTPRMLEPADTGGSTFWGTRRATSTTNVMMFPAAQPLTRRSSERELDGSKKRATSAGGLDRKPGEGEENDGGTLASPNSTYLRVNRRRTDLMPTIPSPRDGPPTSRSSSASKAFTRSPGRTYSMSRLDQLSQPRKTRINELSTLNEQQQRQQQQQHQQNLGVSSMSRSMSHLAAPGSKGLKKTDNSRSMGTLPGPTSLPRATRAEKLRRKAREHQQQGVRSGEVTPNSLSRPHSSMSQQSATSSVASSNVNMRPRTTTPRRPRPASIAGTGVTVTENKHYSTDMKTTMKDSKPPLPKAHTTPKKPSTPKSNTDSVKQKIGEKVMKSARASPRITPKATPLQSPGTEQSPVLMATEIIMKNEEDNNKEEKKDEGSEKQQIQEKVESKVIVSETRISDDNVTSKVPRAVAESNEKSLLDQEGDHLITDENVDMSASMIAKIRITTEEEAKAALAERRRLAREQAEREAELERQRLEEEARLEMERQRAEEEEQRRLEEETLRLANEARAAEEQRLQQAIEEAQRREEEDRKRREEEARQKIEKEEAERKAREEAEKQRIEMVERLKKEEEERIARRKRVEAIMKRTRGGNSQTNTPTKDGDGEKSKETSPNDESKPIAQNNSEDVMSASFISEATQQLINAEQQDDSIGNNSQNDIVRNGSTHSNGINQQNRKSSLENNQGNNAETELNGHHTNHANGIPTLDNATVKQNNATNNLLDLTEFDTLSNSNSGPILEMSNEDSLNSNLNPTAMPFTPMVVNNPFVPTTNANTNPFQDNFTNNQSQDNQLPDLLS